MRKLGRFLIPVVSLVVLAGCVEVRVNDYVEKVLVLSGKKPLLTKLNFKERTTWTEYSTVCDQAVCGSREEYVCSSHYTCTNSFSALLGSFTVMSGGHHGPISRDRDDDPPRHDPISIDPPRHEDPIPYDPPRHGPISAEPPSRDDDDRDSSSDCGYRQVCGYETVPVYCDVNCREEPVERSSVETIPSEIRVEILGVEDSPKLRKKIKGIFVGVKTNGRFQEVLKDPNFLPKKIRSAFATLKESDRTIVILDAKGLELVPGQEILELGPDFKSGDGAVLKLTLRETSGGRKLSAVGTATDFPPLETSRRRE